MVWLGFIDAQFISPFTTAIESGSEYVPLPPSNGPNDLAHFASKDIALEFILLLAWGIHDGNLDLNNTSYYHFEVILELKEDYGGKTIKLRMKTEHIIKQKKVKKRDAILDGTRTAKKNYSQQNFFQQN